MVAASPHKQVNNPITGGSVFSAWVLSISSERRSTFPEQGMPFVSYRWQQYFFLIHHCRKRVLSRRPYNLHPDGITPSHIL